MLIHHHLLGRELEVSEAVAEVMTTNPRVPWRYGPLPDPTAATTTPDEGDDSLNEED